MSNIDKYKKQAQNIVANCGCHGLGLTDAQKIASIPEMTKAIDSGLKQLRLAINTALHDCLRSATPNVCAMAETKEGYHTLELQILELCITKSITPATAIVTIESEMSNNE